MNRLRTKVALYSALICLPAALIIGVGATAVVMYVPGYIRIEPARIGRMYREIAEDLIAGRSKPDYTGPRLEGWRGTRKIDRYSWGYEAGGRHVTVWCQSPQGGYFSKNVPPFTRFPYAAVFYFGGFAVAFVLVFLTAAAVWHFVNLNRSREALLKDKEDFVAATVHDLTTPLSAMRHLIGRDDAEAANLNERMIRIVKNLKAFMNLGGSRPVPVKKEFDIVETCMRSYEMFRRDYEDSFSGGVVFTGEKKLPVRADETMTEQILWNLFGNDLKYAAPFGRVIVDFSRSRTRAKVSFIDEGDGLSEAEMKNVFKRYYRASRARSSGKGGFGVGLCTALEFATAMGGDLTVCANRPRGCVFSLELESCGEKRH